MSHAPDTRSALNFYDAIHGKVDISADFSARALGRLARSLEVRRSDDSPRLSF